MRLWLFVFNVILQVALLRYLSVCHGVEDTHERSGIAHYDDLAW